MSVNETLLENLMEENKTYNQKLIESSKPKNELVVGIDCLVETVYSKTQRKSHTPNSEATYGGTSPVYDTGISVNKILQVKPSDSNCILKEVEVKFDVPVRSEDKIRIYFLAGEEKAEKGFITSSRDCITHWVGRELTEKEEAFKIEYLKDGEVIETYE